MTSIEQKNGKGFLAFPEMTGLLVSELKTRYNFDVNAAIREKKAVWYGDLLYLENGEDLAPYWASTILADPFILHFDSIGEASKTLSAIQRNWAPYNYNYFRRAALISEKLPYLRLKPRAFPFQIPDSPMGLYTLIDEKTIIASAKTSSPVPLGQIEFIEDHENPPSRAYLKIQESLTWASYFGLKIPDENSRCFDAGACPGGWTYVLRQLGSEVFAVDRAPLCDELMADEKVEFLAHDAFTLEPEKIGPFDWVFSDVICYPERLFEWVKKWISSGKTDNMICTIKMQGEIDWKKVSEFSSIPNSKVIHLRYNKHELTWIWSRNGFNR